MTGRPLPRNTDAALAAIAAGHGREPSVAHPECKCCPGSTRIVTDDDVIVCTKKHDGYITPESRRACPVHGKQATR